MISEGLGDTNAHNRCLEVGVSDRSDRRDDMLRFKRKCTYVRLAPPSRYSASKSGPVSQFHVAAGSMSARFEYKIPLQPPATLLTGSTQVSQKYVFHSSVTKSWFLVYPLLGLIGIMCIP